MRKILFRCPRWARLEQWHWRMRNARTLVTLALSLNAEHRQTHVTRSIGY
jgi:hypothetical protein